MIIDLNKYLFVGARGEIADFFIQAQEKGFIEFIGQSKGKGGDLPEPVRRLVDAIKILRKQPVKEAYPSEEGLDVAHEIADQVMELLDEVEKLREERRFLEGEMARIAPFGEFSFDDIEFIETQGKKKVQFYCVKTSKGHEVEKGTGLIYVGTEYDLDYYIGIHEQTTSYPGMIEMHFDRTVEELKNHRLFVEETLHQVEAELKGYAGYLEFLRESLLEQFDIHNLQKAHKQVSHALDSQLFTIEGWVPNNQKEELENLLEGRAVHAERIAIESEDKVPTYMANQKIDRIGEDLVRIYDIPAPTDKDPSKWVIWAFALFFAMILADGGYGLLYLGLAFFLKRKFPDLKGAGRRFLKLLFILSTSCVIWGVLTTSFFGIEFGPKSPLSRFSLINHLAAKKASYHKEKNDDVYTYWVKEVPSLAEAKTGKEMLTRAVVEKEGRKKYALLEEFSDNILLELSLFIGVVHISLSLLRYVKRSWANIGWVAFAVGGYLYFPVTLHATSMMEFLGWVPKDLAQRFGIQLVYGGIAIAVILGLIQKKLKGLAEITQIIQVFADILSYLRLYALALASTIMARTFNDLGVEVGLVVGSVIILAGHAINLLLGTMGGVIHGLRLNFIEWYHYSFEGEGKLFNPLRRLRIKQE